MDLKQLYVPGKQITLNQKSSNWRLSITDYLFLWAGLSTCNGTLLLHLHISYLCAVTPFPPPPPTQPDEPCIHIVGGETGFIRADNYPRRYRDRSDCKWVVLGAPYKVLVFTFLRWSRIEDDISCSKDTLTVIIE